MYMCIYTHTYTCTYIYIYICIYVLGGVDYDFTNYNFKQNLDHIFVFNTLYYY